MVWTVLVVVAAQHPVSLLHPLLQADMLQDKFRAEDESQRSGQDARRCEHRLFCWWAGSARGLLRRNRHPAVALVLPMPRESLHQGPLCPEL